MTADLRSSPSSNSSSSSSASAKRRAKQRQGPARAREQRLVQGNEACAWGALYAGCSFFAGYPITPSSEVLEIMARELPRRGGVFIQMEDELGSLSAVIGAAWAGAKAMTATSGPGFSLMQENLGYAALTGTPCVILDAQRWGPSTGQATRTSQGDLMQAIWGTHGDHPVIVLTASGVRDAFEMTVNAFNFAERHRMPVVLLTDEVLAHMRENIVLPEPGELEVVSRRRPASLEGFKPFRDETWISFGEGARFNVTGMAHDETGLPVEGEAAEYQLRRLMARLEEAAPSLTRYEGHGLDDAEVLLVSYGITSRAALAAVGALRREGIRAGLLDLKTLWPFPAELVRQAASRARYVLVPELNLGQAVREVRLALEGRVPVEALGRVDGNLITPQQITDRVKEGIKTRASRAHAS